MATRTRACLARTAGGAIRNTETTSGAVVSYNQPPGVLRIPCDVGDIWQNQNDTRNTLFRSLPTNWVSIRLRLASFAPTQNYQQAGLLGIDGNDQLTLAYFDQALTVTRGKYDSSLRVHGQIGGSSKFLHCLLTR